MLNKALVWTTVAVICAGYLQGAAPQSSNSGPPPAPSTQRAVLDQYCGSCHNDTSRVAGLTLDNADLERVGNNAPVWEKVVRKLRTRTMPPAGAQRPDKATYSSLATYLEGKLDSAAAGQPNP